MVELVLCTNIGKETTTAWDGAKKKRIKKITRIEETQNGRWWRPAVEGITCPPDSLVLFRTTQRLEDGYIAARRYHIITIIFFRLTS